jgi:hypothetical protein
MLQTKIFYINSLKNEKLINEWLAENNVRVKDVKMNNSYYIILYET